VCGNSVSAGELLYNKTVNNSKITVDYREKPSGLHDLLKNCGALVEIAKLSYGDYIINDKITVERKTADDFLISIIDRRLFNQLSNLKKICSHPILLIEGNPYKSNHNFDRMAIKGTLVSTKVMWYVPVIFSRTKEDSRDILLMISRQVGNCIDVAPIRGGYRPKRLRSKQLYILQSLPKVGPKLAKKLLQHFKSISNVINASAQDLSKIEGIGKITAEKIRKVLDTGEN
jgi:Fanconi anemia group M protein